MKGETEHAQIERLGGNNSVRNKSSVQAVSKAANKAYKGRRAFLPPVRRPKKNKKILKKVLTTSSRCDTIYIVKEREKRLAAPLREWKNVLDRNAVLVGFWFDSKHIISFLYYIKKTKTIGDDNMRELNTIAKQKLKNDLIAAYDDIFNMIIADYIDYHDDDDDTLQGIASLTREYLTDLTNHYTEMLANLKH